MPAEADEWYATPTLTGRHVRLEALTTSHIDGLLAAADDAEVFQWIHYPAPPAGRSDVEQWVSTMDVRREAKLGIAWTQIDVRSGVPAGMTTYYEIDPVNRAVGIGGTWLGRRWWRTGLNTEAKLLLLTRAFECLGAVRVVWHTDILNTRSQQAIERLGAQREGILRKHKLRRDGSWRDSVQYAMTDDEWPQAKLAIARRLR
jgi:RimJ/RimL family protein N-acetyltransferase